MTGQVGMAVPKHCYTWTGISWDGVSSDVTAKLGHSPPTFQQKIDLKTSTFLRTVTTSWCYKSYIKRCMLVHSCHCIRDTPPTSLFGAPPHHGSSAPSSGRVPFCSTLQWHKVNTKFHPNPSSGSRIEQAVRQDRPALYAFISRTSCKEHIKTNWGRNWLHRVEPFLRS
jgi:hypothetical protein